MRVSNALDFVFCGTWGVTPSAHVGDKVADIEILIAADGDGVRRFCQQRPGSRSAVSVATAAQTFATRPWRLSSSTWPAYDSFASVPAPFRASRASPSVVD